MTQKARIRQGSAGRRGCATRWVHGARQARPAGSGPQRRRRQAARVAADEPFELLHGVHVVVDRAPGADFDGRRNLHQRRHGPPDVQRQLEPGTSAILRCRRAVLPGQTHPRSVSGLPECPPRCRGELCQRSIGKAMGGPFCHAASVAGWFARARPLGQRNAPLDLYRPFRPTGRTATSPGRGLGKRFSHRLTVAVLRVPTCR